MKIPTRWNDAELANSEPLQTLYAAEAFEQQRTRRSRQAAGAVVARFQDEYKKSQEVVRSAYCPDSLCGTYSCSPYLCLQRHVVQVWTNLALADYRPDCTSPPDTRVEGDEHVVRAMVEVLWHVYRNDHHQALTAVNYLRKTKGLMYGIPEGPLEPSSPSSSGTLSDDAPSGHECLSSSTSISERDNTLTKDLNMGRTSCDCEEMSGENPVESFVENNLSKSKHPAEGSHPSAQLFNESISGYAPDLDTANPGYTSSELSDLTPSEDDGEDQADLLPRKPMHRQLSATPSSERRPRPQKRKSQNRPSTTAFPASRSQPRRSATNLTAISHHTERQALWDQEGSDGFDSSDGENPLPKDAKPVTQAEPPSPTLRAPSLSSEAVPGVQEPIQVQAVETAEDGASNHAYLSRGGRVRTPRKASNREGLKHLIEDMNQNEKDTRRMKQQKTKGKQLEPSLIPFVPRLGNSSKKAETSTTLATKKRGNRPKVQTVPETLPQPSTKDYQSPRQLNDSISLPPINESQAMPQELTSRRTVGKRKRQDSSASARDESIHEARVRSMLNETREKKKARGMKRPKEVSPATVTC